MSESKNTNNRFLPVIAGLFVATLLISVTVAKKLFVLGPFVLSASVLLFPLAFIFDDILTEVYGYARARRIIWTGFLAELLLVLSYNLAIALGPPDFFKDQAAYELVLGQAFRVVVASLSAYIAGEFCNSYVLAKMKVWSEGRLIRTRFITSTVVGQGIDSLFFYPIAFFGDVSFNQLGVLIVSAWFVKVVWEVIALPVSVPIANALKRAEHEDVYDRTTDFNPIRF